MTWQVGKSGGRVGSEEVASEERCNGRKVARWERKKNGEMARWEVPAFIQEWGTQGESQISSFCF